MFTDFSTSFRTASHMCRKLFEFYDQFLLSPHPYRLSFTYSPYVCYSLAYFEVYSQEGCEAWRVALVQGLEGGTGK